MKRNSFLFKVPPIALDLQNKEMTPASTELIIAIAVHMYLIMLHN